MSNQEKPMTKKPKKLPQDYPWVWTRKSMPQGREGQRCKVLERLNNNAVRVRFMKDDKEYLVQDGGLKKASKTGAKT